MKKAISIHMRIFWILYAVFYLIKTYMIWQFENPFKWFIDIPTYTVEERGNYLLVFVSVHLLIIPFSSVFFYVKPKSENNEFNN
jgi:hypothetical protein